MQKFSFLIFTTCLFFVFSCKNDAEKTTNAGNSTGHAPLSAEFLEGNWVAKSFINRIKTRSSVAQSLKSQAVPFSLAFSFSKKKPDSVLCYQSERMWSLPVKYNHDTLEIPGGKDGKPVFLVYSDKPEKSFIMFDNTSGQLVQNYFIAAADKTSNGLGAFFTVLNFETVSDYYTLKGSSEKVAFSPNGIITGWKEYDYFQICIGGRCQILGPDIDCIYLMNRKTSKGKWFGFQLDQTDKTLTIFDVKENPAKTPEYILGNVKYEFEKAPAPDKKVKENPAGADTKLPQKTPAPEKK